MENIYFANKILIINDFLYYNKKHNEQLGCNIGNYYYLDNRIFTFKLIADKYIDTNGCKYSEIDISKLKKMTTLLCQDCEHNYQKIYSHKCEEKPKSRLYCVGITNLEMLSNYLQSYDPENAMQIIDKYNSEIGEYYTYIDLEHKLYNENIDKINTKVKKYLKK